MISKLLHMDVSNDQDHNQETVSIKTAIDIGRIFEEYMRSISINYNEKIRMCPYHESPRRIFTRAS